MREIKLPFQGFYESKWSGIADMWIEREVEYTAERESDPKDYPEEYMPGALQISAKEYGREYWDFLNYRDLESAIAKDYAQSFCEKIAEETGFPLKGRFAAMDSPKYYNFETDRIFIKVPDKTARALVSYVRKHCAVELADMIRERHASYDGFISFYRDDPEEWASRAWHDFDHNELETFLLALIKAEISDPDDFEWSIYYPIAEQDYSYCDSAFDWPRFEAWQVEQRQSKYEALDPEEQQGLWKDYPALLRELFPEAVNPYEVNRPYRCPVTSDMFGSEGKGA